MTVSSLSYARVGPVHFQPLEWELRPLSGYIRGHVLNAGCGNRDVTNLLRQMGATGIVNLDLASSIPGAILGSLDSMPLGDRTFDAVLCNAVLEHVDSANNVMAEMVRVLKPGGYIVASVPFLQPYHESPTDYRRFTQEGMRQLGQSFGLEVVAILPVHNIAQTLGWIAWEYACERKSRILKGILWPLIWLATRLSCRTNSRLTRSANTFQAVYRK